MSESLLKMREDAIKDNVYLVFLSGFRSIQTTKKKFYSNKPSETGTYAPPGYSENHTGFAIDLGDAYNRESDFKVEFERTLAFKFLKNNAAKYHFKPSFSMNNIQGVPYMPWHWRYEGSIESLKIFEAANRLF